MNNEVRKFLIDRCVKGEPVYYEAIGRMLNLNLSNISDRNILSKTLGDISTYEYENGRPLISSIVIYKTNNDHGYGFYNLCEQLGIGKASKLSKELYGFSQIEECKKFWKSSENYNAYINLESEKRNHEMDFFTPGEMDFFETWSGRVYNKDSAEHVAAKNYIMESLGLKIKYWSNQLIKKLSGLDTSNPRVWSKQGWKDTPEGIKVRASIFKPYTWARIYRKGDKHKDIFFTVSASGKYEALVYKLDCYYGKNSNLNKSQKEVIEKNIPDELRWQSIKLDELTDYNWDSLLDLSASFISKNLYIYDKLIELAWGDSTPEKAFSNFLRPRKLPQNGYSTLPEMKPKFEGIEKDFLEESIEKKEIGDAGEELVKQFEIDQLINSGKSDLAEQVAIVKDGKGYDVLSFDSNGTPKYIEVKTTTGKELEPFHYSINEKLFAEKNWENYFIYRLYNYDNENNTADFFIINNINESLLMQPTEFKVYLKREE